MITKLCKPFIFRFDYEIAYKVGKENSATNVLFRCVQEENGADKRRLDESVLTSSASTIWEEIE